MTTPKRYPFRCLRCFLIQQRGSAARRCTACRGLVLRMRVKLRLVKE